MSSPGKIKAQFGTIRKIHSFMLAGLALFTLVASTVLKEKFTDTAGRNITYLIVAGVAMGVLIFASAFVYRRILTSKAGGTLYEKLQGYQAACLAQWAMIEFPVLLSVIFFLITSDLLFVAYILTGMVIFLMNRPSKAQFVNDATLTDDERKAVNEA